MSWNDGNRSRCLGPISATVMSYDIGSAALLASRGIYLESGKYSYDLLEPGQLSHTALVMMCALIKKPC